MDNVFILKSKPLSNSTKKRSHLCSGQKFVKAPIKAGEYFPISFRNDYLGVDQEVFTYANDQVTAVNYELQHGLADFANGWMRNIKEQQEL